MDEILTALQGQAFHLSDPTFKFLADRCEKLVGMAIPDLTGTAIHADTVREIIRLHRAQFHSAEYLQSRRGSFKTPAEWSCEIVMGGAPRQ